MTPNALLPLLARWALAAIAVLPLLVAGCGGGVGTGGTGTYASGPITGFGSVIVNDIRFDDSAAAVLDDDGAGRLRSELKLGMTVEVDGDALAVGATGSSSTASRIRFGSEIVGPVQAVDAVGGTLAVLGQTVKVAVETVFDEALASGLASLAAGQVVEVYAQYDAATGAFNATRIEPKAAATSWRLRAPVGAIDAASQTLRIGGADFFYGTALGVPPDLAVGQLVRLRIATDGAGRHVVTAFATAVRPPEDREDARLRGMVTAIASATRFEVNGLPVDASGAHMQGGMGVGGLRVGARVDARGPVVAGVLQATEVKVESDDDVRARGFELHGSIDSVDAAARTFRLRGMTIGYARPDLRFDNGSAADLAPGRRVEVRAQPSPDRTRLDAVRIQFE
jgi:hypothetical protein